MRLLIEVDYDGGSWPDGLMDGADLEIKVHDAVERTLVQENVHVRSILVRHNESTQNS